MEVIEILSLPQNKTDITKIQRRKMIEQWVQDYIPNAILRHADARLENRCAVYVVAYKGDFGVRCTEFLPLEQLEQYLLGVFNASEFYSKIKC